MIFSSPLLLLLAQTPPSPPAYPPAHPNFATSATGLRVLPGAAPLLPGSSSSFAPAMGSASGACEFVGCAPVPLTRKPLPAPKDNTRSRRPPSCATTGAVGSAGGAGCLKLPQATPASKALPNQLPWAVTRSRVASGAPSNTQLSTKAQHKSDHNNLGVGDLDGVSGATPSHAACMPLDPCHHVHSSPLPQPSALISHAALLPAAPVLAPGRPPRPASLRYLHHRHPLRDQRRRRFLHQEHRAQCDKRWLDCRQLEWHHSAGHARHPRRPRQRRR